MIIKKLVLSIIVSLLIIVFPGQVLAKPISDLSGHWAEKEVQEWLALGFIEGYEDYRFRPDQLITKAEFISMVNIALALKNEDVQDFVDMEKTGQLGNNVCRQEAVVIIANLLRLNVYDNISVLNEFTDSATIPLRSMPSINEAVRRGYLKGYPDKTLRPDAPITRAETVAILSRVFGTIVQEGTYGPDAGTQIIKGNLTINNPGIKLKNIVITGDLYCTAGIGNGSIYIENCKIEGRTIISGGGENSIVFTNTSSSSIIIYKTGGSVRILAKGNTSLHHTTVETPAILEEDHVTGEGFDTIEIVTVNPGENIELIGNYQNIIINSQINITISGTTTINNISLSEEAAGSIINLGNQAIIENITINTAAQVTGPGKVISAVINANNVSIEQQVQNLVMSENVQSVIMGGKTVTGTSQESGGDSDNNISNPGHITNDEPIALSDSALTTKNNLILITVLTNDSDPDGDTISIVGYTQGVHGSVVQEISGNRFNYTPETGFTGNDSFNYTISDGNGGTATATVNITVNEPIPDAPAASFTCDLTSGVAPLTVTLTNTSTGTVDSLSWDFNGDGTPDNTTDNNVNFTFVTPGTYTASLTVTNAGGSNTFSRVITVNTPIPSAPAAIFTCDLTSGEAPLTVTLTNTSTGTVNSLSWDFNGDGTPDNTADNTATFTFDNPGTYTASLTVTNAGGSTTFSQVITVNL